MRDNLFNEKEILFKTQTGLEFQSTYKKFYPKLVYYVNNMIKDEDESEDITMDSFLMALDKISKYDKDKSQFSTWLFTIAKNITLQKIKERKRNISIDNEMDSEGTTLKDFISDDILDIDPIEDLSDKKAKLIKKEMDNLKEPYKSVIMMREIDKMAYKDISDKLGRNLSTIKSQIRGARKILIKSTKKEFDTIDKMYS